VWRVWLIPAVRSPGCHRVRQRCRETTNRTKDAAAEIAAAQTAIRLVKPSRPVPTNAFFLIAGQVLSRTHEYIATGVRWPVGVPPKNESVAPFKIRDARLAAATILSAG